MVTEGYIGILQGYIRGIGIMEENMETIIYHAASRFPEIGGPYIDLKTLCSLLRGPSKKGVL